MKYVHCPACVERNDFTQGYSVAVGDGGDLYIICEEHKLENGGPFLSIANDHIEDALMEIALEACHHCDGKHEGSSH